MLEKAEKIQKLRGNTLWVDGDFYTDTILMGRASFSVVQTEYADEPYEMYKPIWLPRQDQLQKMVRSKFANNLDMLMAFYAFVTEDKPFGFDAIFNAPMEQLWLAFVMKEKYNKVWNGEKWIKK